MYYDSLFMNAWHFLERLNPVDGFMPQRHYLQKIKNSDWWSNSSFTACKWLLTTSKVIIDSVSCSDFEVTCALAIACDVGVGLKFGLLQCIVVTYNLHLQINESWVVKSSESALFWDVWPESCHIFYSQIAGSQETFSPRCFAHVAEVLAVNVWNLSHRCAEARMPTELLKTASSASRYFASQGTRLWMYATNTNMWSFFT